jgi:universal stress protein F
MKRILVALDASPRAPAVLASARRLAELTGARLVLFRAINLPSELPREILEDGPLVLEDVLRRDAQAALSYLAHDLPPGVVEATITELAIPWDGIVRAAVTHDADLIVVGSHGFRGLDHLLGTTAAKVVNHADRDVLVVRARP